jgi:hypothetical protein
MLLVFSESEKRLNLFGQVDPKENTLHTITETV